jgi:DNA-binding CsgD family transcriptional regulator/PAS domain-containing protein
MAIFSSDGVTANEMVSIDAVHRAEGCRDANDDLLQAFGQLLNARSVDLVRFQSKDRATSPIAEWSRDGHPANLRASSVKAAILEEARLMRPRNRSADNDPTSVFATEVGTRDGGTVYLVIHFDRYAQRADLVPLMLGLVANLRYVFSLQAKVAEARASAAAAMAALDRDKCGVVAVTEEGQIVFMNSAAATALSRGAVIQLSHNTIRPTHYPDAIRFLAALDMIAARSPAKSRDAIIMRLNGSGLAAPMIISIAPFGDDAAISDGRPVGIIHFLQQETDDAGLSAVCRLFGLSPIEAQLARHLFNGRTLADAAVAMHIKTETARSYLKQIFAKTDTHRQAELIGMLSQYSVVVRNTYRYIAV